MNTIFLSWNPDEFNLDSDHWLRLFQRDGFIETTWSARAYKLIRSNDRVLFLKQGGQGRGLVAIGYAATPCFAGDDWRGKGSRQYYLWVRFSAFVDPRKELLLSDHEICNILRRDKLHLYSSGSFLKAQAEDLDKLWDLALSAAKERGALQSLEAIRAPKDPLAGDNTLTGQAMAKALSELSFTKSQEQLLLTLYESDNHSGTPAEIADKAGEKDESHAKLGFSEVGKKIAKHLSLGPLPATETEPSLSLDHILVEEKWDENQPVWILRPVVVYAIRKSWVEFVVPFDEPAGGYKRKSALELSESDKQRCLLAHNFRCWQCGFDARREYPGIPTGFLEVRINPTRVATPEPGLIDPERDLVPLCGHCLIQMESSEA